MVQVFSSAEDPKGVRAFRVQWEIAHHVHHHQRGRADLHGGTEWLLLAALKEHPKINLSIRERGELEDENDEIGPNINGPKEYLKGSAKEYRLSTSDWLHAGRRSRPVHVLHRRADVGDWQPRDVQRRTRDPAHVLVRQHDGWDLNTRQYVEERDHTMWLRLLDASPNVSVNISEG